jgi:hypothetical protein
MKRVLAHLGKIRGLTGWEELDWTKESWMTLWGQVVVKVARQFGEELLRCIQVFGKSFDPLQNTGGKLTSCYASLEHFLEGLDASAMELAEVQDVVRGGT